MIWREPTHWHTHPPNQPPIHLSKGGSVSTNHKSSNRIELSRLDQILLKFLWFHIFRPTNPPIHPPTHQKKHPPMGGEFSTDSKSSNGIEISWFAQVLSRFYWFGGGYPPWGVGGCGLGGCAHTCMHVKHDKHGCLHGGGHLQFSNMFIFAFHACVCVHVHVHVSRDTPHAPRCPPTHLSPPQSHREPQGALHPPAPPPWSRRSRNLKNAIKREQIEIIEFRLKICDPWALLHTYRLDLMCRWEGGCPIPNGTFMFWAQ